MKIFFEHIDRPWQRGNSDCFAAAADQLRGWFDIDPMERYRGRYRTLTGYLRIIRADGYKDAMEAFCGELERRGWQSIQDGFDDRDVGLIRHYDGPRITASPAIFHDGGWNIKTKQGWFFLMGNEGLLKAYRYGT